MYIRLCGFHVGHSVDDFDVALPPSISIQSGKPKGGNPFAHGTPAAVCSIVSVLGLPGATQCDITPRNRKTLKVGEDQKREVRGDFAIILPPLCCSLQVKSLCKFVAR